MQKKGEENVTVVANATFGTPDNIAQYCLNIKEGYQDTFPAFFVKARNLDGNIENASLAAQYVYSAVSVNQTFIDIYEKK